MSRRHSAEKREINPDAKFGNLVVSKFMNSIMIQGKKSVAEAIVYGAFVHLADFVVLAGVIENPLSGRGLAGIDVGHDAEVAVVLDGMGARHGGSFS